MVVLDFFGTPGPGKLEEVNFEFKHRFELSLFWFIPLILSYT